MKPPVFLIIEYTRSYMDGAISSKVVQVVDSREKMKRALEDESSLDDNQWLSYQFWIVE